MATFRTRIAKASERRGGLILANDYPTIRNLESRTIRNIETLHPFLCGIKLNFHLLLPLGRKEIKNITSTAHRRGLQVIADIKLNDINSTNLAATAYLWEMGLDAVIANPIMGPGALKSLVVSAHKKDRGVITLCHMSAPEAKESYELETGGIYLYEMFLKWALESRADGIIAGATYPQIIRRCSERARGRLDIFSPGVGTQGGSAKEIILAGTRYVIAGRSILESSSPAREARHLQSLVRQPS
ncbi:MAG: orotidine 5'-phosphate decarboxylase [Nitrosopumilus sp. B06]|nr:MAG: orotidine 5'-phosphate decarboxylase [Nitrosopumilus sp. B06]